MKDAEKKWGQLAAALAVTAMALSPVSAAGATCDAGSVTVFYVNGVKNTFDEARLAARALAEKYQTFVGRPLTEMCIGVHYSWNQTDGLLLDLLQSGVQLVDGVESRFWEFWADLSIAPDFFQHFAEEQLGVIDATAFILREDLARHVARYRQDLTERNGKVVLVGHSQGNFYSNEAHRIIYGGSDGVQPLRTQSLGLVAVATPASIVEPESQINGEDRWVTLVVDFIYRFAPLALLGNTIDRCGDLPLCHSFVDSYMAGEVSRPRTLRLISTVIGELESPDSDGNGLSDGWEQRYFGRIGNDPNADFDHDGASNAEEFRRGTDPTDPASRPPVPAPAGLTAFVSGPSSIRLAWQDIATNETGYRVLRVVGTDQVFSLLAVLGPNIGTSPATYEDIGLEPETTYCYRVQAVGGSVTSNPSNVDCATTSTATLTAPSGLTASAGSSSEILLSWQDNATNETEYRVERRVGTGGAFSFLTSLAPNTIAFQNNGLTGNTLYCYRVQAAAETVVSDFSNEACAPTNPPPPSTSITVNNPSFEVLPAGGLPFIGDLGGTFSRASIPGWVNSGDSGQFQPGTNGGAYFNALSSGPTVGYSNGGTISQTVGATVQAGVVYTLQVDVGLRNDDCCQTGTVQLLIGGTVIQATGSVPPQGFFSTFTAVYTGLPADVGKPITIQLSSTAQQGDFDNVRLTANIAESIGDNFDDNFLDPARWAVLAPPPGFSAAVAETNQRLEVSVGPGAGGGGIVSRCVVAGDFDVQVDFSLLSWPLHNSHNVRLGAVDLGIVGSLGVGPFGAVGVNRSSFEGEKYVMVFTDAVAQAATSQATGRLRLVRTGSTLSGFFHNGSDWMPVGSGASSTGPTRFNLDVGTTNPSAPGGIIVAFDNFRVNAAGTISCPELSPPHLSVGARVQTTSNLFVRTGPSDFSFLTGVAGIGSLGTIIEGPIVGPEPEGFTWWQINYDNDPDGWSVQDFLIVAPGAAPPPLPLPTPAPISVGVRVQTTTNLFVRTGPSGFNPSIGVAGVGSLGTVIGGPVSADGFTWWQINYDNDPDGWSVGDFLTVVVQ